MKPLKLQILLFLFPSIVLGQLSERFVELHKGLEKVDCETISTTYRNGNPKYCGTTTYYRNNNEEYAFLTGKHTRYYKDGSKNESTYDIYGNAILHEFYNKNGVLTTVHETILLDSDAENLTSLINGETNKIFEVELREYKIYRKTGKRYLYKKGRYRNGKKIGIWTYYNPDGGIKKEITKNVVQHGL